MLQQGMEQQPLMGAHPYSLMMGDGSKTHCYNLDKKITTLRLKRNVILKTKLSVYQSVYIDGRQLFPVSKVIFCLRVVELKDPLEVSWVLQEAYCASRLVT